MAWSSARLLPKLFLGHAIGKSRDGSHTFGDPGSFKNAPVAAQHQADWHTNGLP